VQQFNGTISIVQFVCIQFSSVFEVARSRPFRVTLIVKNRVRCLQPTKAKAITTSTAASDCQEINKYYVISGTFNSLNAHKMRNNKLGHR